MQKIAAILVLALSLGWSAPALAHKVVAGAYASGDAIEGEIGFSDGEPAKNVLVEVFDEDGTRLGEVRTKEDGTFVFEPKAAVTHIFRADLGAGHVAEIRVDRSELPASLTTGGQPTPDAAGGPPLGEASSAAAPSVAPPVTAEPPPQSSPAALTEAQRAVVAELIRNEIRPLRREVIAYREKNDLQSILGGIGYIVGLFGLWFFLAARRQARAG
ncbi:cobalt ABC transporter permease [Blastochloris sulfoviridis]|uniref:Cobalt ABC transporter permease n=1 Tax=Blastochloris sulfoviridis TaxID=50712 RepID=A0A5M6I2Z7_9HYPH|nr:cobalt ABC transporter permease [Blastochloris sulfoviridis]KAA5602165.1 cobalt ABC transporter permease [Blastochloris sulfoviridis]